MQKRDKRSADLLEKIYAKAAELYSLRSKKKDFQVPITIHLVLRI